MSSPHKNLMIIDRVMRFGSQGRSDKGRAGQVGRMEGLKFVNIFNGQYFYAKFIQRSNQDPPWKSDKVMKARSSGRAVQGTKILRKVKVKFYVDNILMQNQFKG